MLSATFNKMATKILEDIMECPKSKGHWITAPHILKILTGEN
jgi:hypothetical protein